MIRIPLLVVALVVAARAAGAQPEPQRLPDLTPQVFTIEGHVEAALPQIERQPLSGFGPPPRTYVVPADRRAFVDPYGPDLHGLGAPALPAPTPPPIDLAAGRFGRIAAGAGRYVSRFGRVDLSLPIDEGRAGSFVADVDYDGLGSGDEATYVEGDRLSVVAGWRGNGTIRPSVEGGFVGHSHALPGAGLTSARTRSSAFGSVRVDGPVAPATGMGFGAGVRYRHARLTGDGTFAADLSEGGGDADARVDVAGGRLRLDAAAGASGRDVAFGSDQVYYAAGGAVHLGRPNGATIVAGARVLGYDASVGNGGGESNVVAPTLAIELPFSPTATFFARTEGRVVRRGLADLLDENPFVEPAPLLVPDIMQADAAAGLEVRAGAVGLRVAAEGQFMPTRAVFDRGAGGLFAVTYERARIFGGSADLTVVTPSGAEGSAGVTFRRGELTATDSDIPYLSTITGHAGVQVPFADQRGRVGLSGAVWGPRPADRTGLRTLPTAGSMALDVAWRVRGGLEAILHARHLLGRAERWDGFPEAPLVISVGAQYIW